jgi:hypothetical protein
MSPTRYDKPFKYNKAVDAYVVTMQKPTKNKLGIYEVTLGHGDRAMPHGFVVAGTKFDTYMFSPGHAGSHEHGRQVGTSKTLQEAISDVRKAWEAGA